MAAIAASIPDSRRALFSLRKENAFGQPNQAAIYLVEVVSLQIIGLTVFPGGVFAVLLVASCKTPSCSQSYHIKIRSRSIGVSSGIRKISSRMFMAFAISFKRFAFGLRYPISYCAMRFALLFPYPSISPNFCCVRPRCSRTSLIRDPVSIV